MYDKLETRHVSKLKFCFQYAEYVLNLIFMLSCMKMRFPRYIFGFQTEIIFQPEDVSKMLLKISVSIRPFAGALCCETSGEDENRIANAGK